MHGHPARQVRCEQQEQQVPLLRAPPYGMSSGWPREHRLRGLLQRVHVCRLRALPAGVFSFSRACLPAQVQQPARAHRLVPVRMQAALRVLKKQLREHHGWRRPVQRALPNARQVQHARLLRVRE